jgi:hypothetical protein
MSLNIIIRKKGSEGERRFKETAESHRRLYYRREEKNGSRFQSKAGSKQQIKEVLDDASRGVGFSQTGDSQED